MHVGQLHLSLPSIFATDVDSCAEGLEPGTLFSHSCGPFLGEACNGKFNSHSHLSSAAHLHSVFKTNSKELDIVITIVIADGIVSVICNCHFVRKPCFDCWHSMMQGSLQPKPENRTILQIERMWGHVRAIERISPAESSQVYLYNPHS